MIVGGVEVILLSENYNICTMIFNIPIGRVGSNPINVFNIPILSIRELLNT